jgi:hypothetical protein
MRALEIHVNGKKICTAGVGDDGVLTAIIRSVLRPHRSSKRKANANEDLGLDVGGLISPSREHIRWKTPQIRTGDEVCIKVIETDLPDKPYGRERSDPAEVERAEERYVQRIAKKMGWQIVKPRPSRARQ